MDLSSLRLDVSPTPHEIDPIRLFNSLTLRGTVNSLYGAQQEALMAWHENHRAKPDVLFSMNTGGGKTLIGLLAAQSLVHESRGKVAYVCVTNQLVAQTAAQAAECGIRCATYGDKRWENKELFDASEGMCVTNYHALFRGGSQFAEAHLRALVFDDAHVAPAKIRDCFTLRFARKHPAWGKLMELLGRYFETSSFAARFRRFATPSSGMEQGVLFVPAFFIYDHLKEITALLDAGNVRNEEDTRYSYRHLEDHLAECGFFVSSAGIEVTPTVLPTHSLPYFRPDVRRLYMTATLPTRYECIRTFGLEHAETIKPSGKAGAAQRLFVIARGGTDTSPYDEVRQLAQSRKACIIVPSAYARQKWLDYGEAYRSKRGHEMISQFRATNQPTKLILAGVYDGIDLPGKTCNVLILDGLLRGACLHDTYLEDILDATGFKASGMAARTTQAIGRIFRSNTDHGVVILADRAQQSWLMSPEHLAYMPSVLQQQIRLGFELRRKIDAGGAGLNYSELMDVVINGENTWDEFYTREITKLEAQQKPKEHAWGDSAARQEYAAFRELWEGRYQNAAEHLSRCAGDVEEHDSALSAWYLHWAGLSMLLAGRRQDGTAFFWQAANKKLCLARPATSAGNPVGETNLVPGPQAQKLARIPEADWLGGLQLIHTKLSAFGGLNAEDHEAALEHLGLCLGFEASRPGKGGAAGPDVLWVLPELRALVAIEAKTQKESPKVYKKNQHIGKVLNDCTWLDERFNGYERRLVIVGPIVGVAAQASPPPDLRIVEISEFVELARRTSQAAQHITARLSVPQSVGDAAETALALYGIRWPECLDSMHYRFAVDLQSPEHAGTDFPEANKE